MRYHDIVGYAFDGALYCPEHAPEAKDTGCTCGKTDENGCCASNCHGYGPNPIFAGDSSEGDCCDVLGCGYLDGCEPETSHDPDEQETEEDPEFDKLRATLDPTHPCYRPYRL